MDLYPFFTPGGGGDAHLASLPRIKRDRVVPVIRVAVEVAAGVLGHEQTSTTLARYTHASRDHHSRVRAALADSRPRSRRRKQRGPLT